MSDLGQAVFAALGMAGVFVLLVIAARVLFEAARPSRPQEPDPVALDRPSIYAVPGTPRRVLHTSEGVVVQFDRDKKPSVLVVEPSPTPMELAVASMLLNDTPTATVSEPTPLEALEARSVEPPFESSPSMAEHTSSFDHGSHE